MSANTDQVQIAWQAVRKIQQLVEAYESGGFTIPGTDLTYDFSSEQITELKADFVEQRNICKDALDAITA